MLFAVLSVFAVMAIAVACGGDDDPATTPAATVASGGTAGATTAGTTAPVVTAPKGTITIQALQFETWDPHFSDFAQDIAHFFMVWRGLYEFDLESKPIPSMADAAPAVSADGKTYTVKLKKDLKWSDGTAIKASDFVAGLQRTCDFANAGHYQYIMTAVVGCDAAYDAKNKDKTAAEIDTLRKAVGVKAIDDLTVEYKLTDAQPTFSILLAMWPTFPIAASKVKDIYDPKGWPGPLENAYNGPFMPKAYTEKASLELVPNPNWSGKQKAQVERIVLRYIDDNAVSNNAYRSGELDAVAANSSELDKLKTEFKFGASGAELYLYPATRTIGLQMQHKDPTLANPDVRIALSRATDRATMMKIVFKDGNTATTSWVPPARNGLKGGEYDSLIGFDVTAAKASLAKAGFANGAGFPKLILLQTDTATNKLLGDFLQAEWRKHLGIDITLEYTDSKSRSAKYNAKDFQLLIGGWQEDYPDPENWFFGLYETGGSLNKQNVSIKELDEVLAKAKFNRNDEERRKQFRDAEKLLLQQASAIAPFWHTQAKFLVKPYIKGMVESKRPGDTFVPGDWNPENWSTTKK